MSSVADQAVDVQRINRRLGWIMSLGGVGLMLGPGFRLAGSAADHPLIWNVGVGFVAGLVLLLAAAGWLLPYWFLRAGWILAPTLAAPLLLLTYAGYSGPSPPPELPWIFAFDATLVAYLVLWLPVWAAIVGTLVTSSLVAVSGAIFLNEIPHVVAAATPIHMANIVFVVLFAEIRRYLLTQSQTRRIARTTRERRVRATIAAEHQEDVARAIHDEVLSALTAAMTAPNPTPPQVRLQAARALQLLAAPTVGVPDHAWRDDTLARLRALTRRIDPECRLNLSGIEAVIPAQVSEAVLAATGEALRNSIRHAGPGASRTISGRTTPDALEVAVTDDGVGFDPLAVRTGALGIQKSIVTPMQNIGGHATISSHPGLATSVRLTWHR